ncbi:MAG: NAD(P)H-dependent oxidoreductase [Sandaracinaceae bacterium]|nr:NAD(P)H-dependent oxidoreductase [Sandaracinaceae bacterium]
MRNALVLLGHADPDSFNAQLARAYRDAVTRAGGRAQLVTLSELSFDPVLRHGYRAPQALEPDLEALRAAIEAADHLAWFFPTYWASPPAIVRAVCDRLFLPGWAFRFEPGKSVPTGLLAGRSARVVITMDSPGWWYALAHHRAIHGSFVTGTLSFVGLAPIHTTTFTSMRTRTDAERARMLASMTRLAGQDLDAPRLPARLALGA